MRAAIEIPAVQRIVTRQMNRWSTEARAADERRVGTPVPRPAAKPWITISREPGAGARALAQILHERLGYDVYGRELLERMADDGPLARAALERVEDGPHGALAEAVYMSLDHAYPGHHAYLKRLVAIGTTLAARGGVILIGRGLHFVLPPDQGLRLRLVASIDYRVRNVMEQRDCSSTVAADWIARSDRSQNALVRRILHKELSDVHFYDMTLDVERLGLERCADVAVAGLRQPEAVASTL